MNQILTKKQASITKQASDPLQPPFVQNSGTPALGSAPSLSETEFSKQERARKMKKYYIECLVCEVSKILIFFAIFTLMDLTTEYLAALFSLMLLRNHGGGLHFMHYVTCLMVSFIFLCAAIGLALLCIPPLSIMICSTGICTFLIKLLVPVTSPNRPPATSLQIENSRKNSVRILILFLCLLCVFGNHPWITIFYWTMILHVFQLMLAKVIQSIQSPTFQKSPAEDTQNI